MMETGDHASCGPEGVGVRPGAASPSRRSGGPIVSFASAGAGCGTGVRDLTCSLMGGCSGGVV